MYALVCRPVADVLPARLTATPQAKRTNGLTATLFWAAVSALIGVATHLIWDSFSHADGYVVTHVAFLHTTVIGTLTGARLVQYLSTVGGLAVLAWALWRRWRDNADLGRPATGTEASVRRWIVLGGLLTATLAAAVMRWIRARNAAPDGLDLEHSLYALVTGAGMGFILAVIVYAALWQTICLRATVARQRCAGAGRS